LGTVNLNALRSASATDPLSGANVVQVSNVGDPLVAA
jgi:hypothetical protein